MNLGIVTTHNDPSAKLFQESSNPNLSVSFFYYENLSKTANFIEEFSRIDKIILRDPYNADLDYSHLLRSIVYAYSDKILIDYNCYTTYPDYEDKLFQAE